MSSASTKPAKESSLGSSGSSGQEGFHSCVVALGTKIEGNFQSAENVRLDGVVVGDLFCDKKLVLGKDGRIEGNVKAKEAVIMGTIVGDIQILGLLHLDRSAVIKGNIQTAALSIEEGASFDGACKVGK